MDEDGFLLELLLIAVLIVINGFFAGAEIAIVSARRAHIQARAAIGERNAAALLELKADPDGFLATVQIGVTVVGTLASAVGGVAAIERVEPLVAALPFRWAAIVAEPMAVATVVGTIAYLSLVIGELIPKSLAVRHADAIALRLARPILALRQWTRPAVAVLTASSRLFLKLVPKRSPWTGRSTLWTTCGVRARRIRGRVARRGGGPGEHRPAGPHRAVEEACGRPALRDARRARPLGRGGGRTRFDPRNRDPGGFARGDRR
jgi:hypothetical protein